MNRSFSRIVHITITRPPHIQKDVFLIQAELVTDMEIQLEYVWKFSVFWEKLLLLCLFWSAKYLFISMWVL